MAPRVQGMHRPQHGHCELEAPGREIVDRGTVVPIASSEVSTECRPAFVARAIDRVEEKGARVRDERNRLDVSSADVGSPVG